MSSSAALQTSSPEAPPRVSSVTMSFGKSQVANEVFGPLDRHVDYVERKLGVQINARGTEVWIDGANAEAAEYVLRELAREVECGVEDITDGLIDAKLRSSGQAVLPGVDESDGANVTPHTFIKTRKKTIVPRTLAQTNYILAMQKEELVFGLGPAGTGKTYLAVAQAVSELIQGNIDKLIFSRPAVEAGEKLGFLPGDMKEKVDPYLRPIYDALFDCLPQEQVERRIAGGEIEVAPLAFMRGRTLANAFIILDEAQNTTREQMKMFLTRFGEGSRMVICGDPNQTDLPGGIQASGLTDATNRLKDVEGIHMTHFTKTDVVRHPIVGRIVEAYEG